MQHLLQFNQIYPLFAIHMNQHLANPSVDWSPILQKMYRPADRTLPVYPGDFKGDLLHHAGLAEHPKAEVAFQLAKEISRLTTCCDPEIAYWFSRLIALIDGFEEGHL